MALAHGALLLALCLTVLAPVHGENKPEVRVLTAAPGFDRATTDAELASLYRDNLEADFAPLMARTFTLGDMLAMLATLREGRRKPRYMVLFVIKANVVYNIPLADRLMPLGAKRSQSMRGNLENGTRLGVKYPDTAFLMNLWDQARCGRTPPLCQVPIFSLIKHWDWENAKGLQADVLLPFFNHVYQDLIFYPWEQKRRTALMRAAMQSGMHSNCTRMWLLHQGKTDPRGHLLDIGITNNLKNGFKAPLVEPIPIPEHAKWKYLLSADGFAASCRFGKLLQTNSVVLKELSSQIEYYYRSVKPHIHYVPFQKENALEVLTGLEAGPDAVLQKMAATAQHFAYRYLSQHAKTLYVRRALEIYNGLYAKGVMERFVGQLDPSQLDGTTSSVEYVMGVLRQSRGL